MEKAVDDFLAACGGAIVLTAFACVFATFIGDGTYQKGIYAGIWGLIGIFAGRQSLRNIGDKQASHIELQSVGVWAEPSKRDGQEDKKQSQETAVQILADELAEAARGGEAALDACFKRLLKKYPNEMLIEALDLGANQLFETEKKWDKLIKDLEKKEAKSR